MRNALLYSVIGNYSFRNAEIVGYILFFPKKTGTLKRDRPSELRGYDF